MEPTLAIAAIADDFTGGTDLAGMLHEGGLATVQFFGLPEPREVAAAARDAQAIVVSLKTRGIPAAEACTQSLAALHALRAAHPRQLQFKYCSTFDSTDRGNIGPVTDALMRTIGADFTVAVPALPVNGRTQFQGHLFVAGRLLSESPLRHHPLNPMTDPDLVRHLQRQTTRRVGLVPLAAVLEGPHEIAAAFARLRAQGVEIALVDAVREQDLAAITEACRGLPLITGGSGFGRHIGPGTQPARVRHGPNKPALIIAGSCSEATRAQLASYQQTGANIIQVRHAFEIRNAAPQLRDALTELGVACIASSAAPEDRTGDAPEAFEQAFAALAREAVFEWGVKSLIVAGGETSGAVVEAAGIRAGRIDAILAPGVPAMLSLHPPGLWFTLKSGNFGGADFFQNALAAQE